MTFLRESVEHIIHTKNYTLYKISETEPLEKSDIFKHFKCSVVGSSVSELHLLTGWYYACVNSLDL